MEEIELEEGEALYYRGRGEDPTIDPDITLSYIGVKLQNVLGHFQKDFEGGVSAENLGAKFGGYGSFLPTYQRSPSWSHTKSPPEVHNYNTSRSPKKLHSEDQRQHSLASPIARLRDASGTTVSMSNSLKGDVYLPFRHVDESILKSGVVKKYINPSDQRTLKVRIKVGSENLPTQKNAEIYSGLGLVVSPSSSLDDSPATGERLSGNHLDVPEGSPTSILQIMTSFSVGLLLSPLSEDLICLTEKIKLRGNSESNLVDKTNTESSGLLVNGSLSSRSNQKVLEQKKWKSSEKDSFVIELTNQKNSGDQNNSISVLKEERETDIDTLGCDELVSNALKLPLLSNSQISITDTANGMSTATIVPLDVSKAGFKEETFSGMIEKKLLDSESAQDIGKVERLGERLGSSGKLSESKKGNLVSSIAACPQYDVFKAEKSHASDQSESNVSKKRKAPSAEPIDPLKQFVVQKGGSGTEEGLKSALEKPSSGGKRKLKGVQHAGAQGAYMPKDQLMADSYNAPKSGKSSHANSFVSKNDSHDLQKDHEKPGDRHNKDVFGDLRFEDDNESVSVEMSSSGRLKDSQLNGKRSTNEYHNASKEKCNKKLAEKPHPSEKYLRVASHVAPPPGNGPSSEAPTGNAPLKDDWVLCDKCHKWRLLPLGTNPKSLPDKWLCRMLTWLPGMNRCSIPEEETTNALRALYHPATSVPAPTSEMQHNQLNNSIGTFVGVPSVDASCPDQENQNIAVLAATISEKKKHGSTHAENSTDIDGSTHSSNSRKNLPTSGKNSNLNRVNHSPLDACGYQHMRQSSSAVEMHNDNQKDKKESLVNCSDTGSNLKIRSKQEPDLGVSRASKRIKEDVPFDDGKWTSDNGGASLKSGRSSTNGLLNNASGSDGHKYTNHKDSKGDAKKNIVSGLIPEIHGPDTSDDGLLHLVKFDGKDSVRKRKGKEHHGSQIHTNPLYSSGRCHQNSGDFVDEMVESDHRKEKKARVSNSGGKDASGSKSRVGTDRKGRSTNKQHNGQYLSKTQAEDYFKSDRSLVQSSVAANSSSSKVSDSCNNKSSAQEVKGSPVESVSSSPLRFYNADKVTTTKKNLIGKDDFQDSYSLTAVSPRRFSGGEDDRGIDRTGMVKKDAILTINDHVPDVYSDPLDHAHNNVSHSKKLGKELSSNSKDKTHTSGSDLGKDKIKASDSSHDYLDHVHLYEEKSKSRRNKFDEKSGTPGKVEKFICKKDTAGGTLGESSKGRSQIKFEGHDGQDVVKIQDKKHSLHQEHDDKKLRKKSEQAEVNGHGKSHSLPPLARVQTETVANLQPVSGSEKENGVKGLAADAFGNGDGLKVPNQNKKAENQNGKPISSRHLTPNSHKARDAETPSPVRRDSSSHAANNALKEAKDLKHLADRLKNSGSTESNALYFQAALKFLHGASLLESGSSEGSKHNELMHSMHIYSSTAKLCEFCAHEYEKSKDMAAVALAYKCMEVAYMRVVNSSHSSANRDRNELQTALQIVPPGESPSSSASDVDNLNQATTDKAAALAKVVVSPQVSGSHIITSQNRSGFMRLLNFSQDVSSAMEASRKSRNAFTAATSKLVETPPKESICSLKKALDFNFQDVEGLLRLVRVSMEAINR